MPEIDVAVARFHTQDACAAAGIDRMTFATWLRREPSAVILTEEDRRAVASGGRHLLTFRTVMQVALTAELVRFGMSPHKAAAASLSFTSSTVADITLGAPGKLREPRRPGYLFRDGTTLLVVHAGDDRPHIVRADDGADWRYLFSTSRGGRRSASCLVINVNAVHARALAALNIG